MGPDRQLAILKDIGFTTMDILPVLVRQCNNFIFNKINILFLFHF